MFIIYFFKSTSSEYFTNIRVFKYCVIFLAILSCLIFQNFFGEIFQFPTQQSSNFCIIISLLKTYIRLSYIYWKYDFSTGCCLASYSRRFTWLSNKPSSNTGRAILTRIPLHSLYVQREICISLRYIFKQDSNTGMRFSFQLTDTFRFKIRWN